MPFKVDLPPAAKQSLRLHASPANSIQVAKTALFPEGLAYNDKSGNFLLGSFRQGAVYEIGPTGQPRLFESDPRLSSVLGLFVDSKRNRLLVANSDTGAALRPFQGWPRKLASLAIFDLTTGKALDFIDLGKLSSGPNHLANDLTVDGRGNAYITDSFSPVIYKVDLQGKASVFLESDRFRAEGVGLNGIVYHPGGFLIVAKKDDGALFKIPLENPNSFSRIKIPDALPGADGLVLAGKDDLVVICNKTPNATTNAVVSLRTLDDWEAAHISERIGVGDVYPTTGTIKDDKLYVVHTKLNELIAAPRDQQGKLNTAPTIEEVGTMVSR